MQHGIGYPISRSRAATLLSLYRIWHKSSSISPGERIFSIGSGCMILMATRMTWIGIVKPTPSLILFTIRAWQDLWMSQDGWSPKAPMSMRKEVITETRCNGGHESIVRLLLDRGADMHAQGGMHGNALQAACYGGHESIVRLLLDRGAVINAQGGMHGNTLQAACYGGHESIVQLLLDRGAVMHAQGGEYGNALQAASYRGHESIVRLLLDRGAEINAQGGQYGNALQAAAATYHGDETIVQLLLDRGADMHAQGGYYGNALQAAAASYRGDETIVQLLLDRGADINAHGGAYRSALQAALAPRGYPPRNPHVVTILWDAGARLYTMPSEAHSEEYIVRLPKMDLMMMDEPAETPETRSSKRRSWS